MQSEVLFAGFGGQGIMTIGKLFAQSGMDAGREVSWIPSYGPEMRGGTAYCLVVLADRPIGSPIIKTPGNLVVMNRPSLEKFAPEMRAGGVCIINSSLIPITSDRADIDQVQVPCNDIAIELGDARAAGIVALGAFCARSGMVPFDLLQGTIKYAFGAKPKLIDLNMAALARGAKAAGVEV